MKKNSYIQHLCILCITVFSITLIMSNVTLTANAFSQPEISFAVVEPMTASNSQTLNVKNGSNITTALDNAMKDASIGIIIIPAGTYKLDYIKLRRSNVVIQAKNVTLNSTGSNHMISTMSGINATGIVLDGGTWNKGSNTGNILYFQSSGSITLKNCTFANGHGYALCVKNSSSFTADNITVNNPQKDGFYVQNCTNVSIKNATVNSSQNGNGINLKDINTLTLDNVTSNYNKSSSGFYLNGIKQLNANKCYASNNGNNAFKLQNAIYTNSNKGIISNSRFTDNTNNGLEITQVSGLVVTNCIAHKNTKNGFIARGFSTNPSMTVEFSSCTSTRNQRDGFYFNSDSYKMTAMLSNCISSNNYEDGARISGTNGKLYVVRGTYNTNGPSNITKSKDGVEAQGIALFNGASAKISDATICSNKAAGVSLYQNKDTKSGISNVTIQRCIINNNLRHGIAAECSKNLNTKENQTNYPIKGLTFDNNTINNNGWHGIMLMVDCYANSISNNNIHGNTLQGIHVANSSISACSNNNVTKNRNGISLRESSTATINNCTFSKNKKAGIRIESKSKATLTKCIASTNGTQGMYFASAGKCSIKDCIANSNKSFGIRISKTTASLYKCIANRNKGAGLDIIMNANITSAKSCTFQNNQKYGIHLEKSKLTLTSSKISNNNSSGIRIENPKSAILTANTIANNKTVGIYITNGCIKRINSNKINNNLESGIFCRQCKVSEIKSNTITGHNKYGMIIDKKAHVKNVKSNKFKNPKANYEIYKEIGCNSNINTTIKTTANAKVGSKKVSGEGCPSSQVNVTIKSESKTKSYKGKTNFAKKYFIKISKLKRGVKINVQIKDSSNNLFLRSIKL